VCTCRTDFFGSRFPLFFRLVFFAITGLSSCGLFDTIDSTVGISGTIATTSANMICGQRSITGGVSGSMAGFGVVTSGLDQTLVSQAVTTPVGADGAFSFRMDTEKDAIILYMNDSAALPEDLVLGFVALRADSGSAIKLPLTDATGDILLGNLVMSGNDLLTDLNYTAIPGLAETAYKRIRELARIDGFYRMIKNIIMNTDSATGIWYTIHPIHTWTTNYPDAANGFVDPAKFSYQGTNFTMTTNDSGRLDDRAVGRGEYILELTPPAGESVTTNDGRVQDGSSPFTSAGSSYVEQAPGLWGAKGDNFWMTKSWGQVYFEIPAFHPIISTPLPSGIWRFAKVSGGTRTELARFDLGEAMPMNAAGISTEYIPVPRINLGSDNLISSIEVKFYLYDEITGSYAEVIDQSILRDEIYDVELWLQDYTGYTSAPEWIHENRDYAFAPVVPRSYAWHYGQTARNDVPELELLFINFKMGNSQFNYTCTWRNF